MRVLIACEYSGRVRDAFIRRGHDALSCDLLPTESSGPHYQGDVRDILGDGWDLMVAHPPCQYLSYAATSSWNKPGRAEKRQEALDFFLTLYNAPIPRVAVENPVGWPNVAFRKPDQIVQPWYFGGKTWKRTCFWLRGLPRLVRTCFEAAPPPLARRSSGKAIYQVDWISGTDRKAAHKRALIDLSLAEAIAEQWGAALLAIHIMKAARDAAGNRD